MGNIKIALVGDIALDTTVLFNDIELNDLAESYPAKSIKSSVGGCIVNHSKSMLAYNIQSEIVSLFANDITGKNLLQQLKKYKISTKYIFPLLNENNKTIILLSSIGNKKIFSNKANLPSQDIIYKSLLPTLYNFEYIHFSINNWNRPLIKKVLQNNPNVMMSTDLHLNTKTLDKDIISNMEVVFFSGANISNPQKIIEEILSMGAEIAICTMGEKGCIVGQKNNTIKRYNAMKQNRPIVDTVGAGDVFASTFLCEYYQKQPIVKAIIKATIQAGKSCTSYGLNNLYNSNELEKEFQILKSMSF